MRRLSLVFVAVVIASVGLAAEAGCPEDGSGELEIQVELHDDPDGLTFDIVFKNAGDGLLLIYPYVVPAGCAPAESPYLQMEVALERESGEVVRVGTECQERLRFPAAQEFLRLSPGDFFGRRINLGQEPFQLSEESVGAVELRLSITSRAKSYLRERHPDELPCAIHQAFEGRLDLEAGLM